MTGLARRRAGGRRSQTLASLEPVTGYKASMDAFDFCWKHEYLDKPRAERWAAFDHARAEGHDFDPDDLMDGLGLDVGSFAERFRALPADDQRAAAKAEAKRLGLKLSMPALIEALRGDRW